MYRQTFTLDEGRLIVKQWKLTTAQYSTLCISTRLTLEL
jgi:hypothetical protein